MSGTNEGGPARPALPAPRLSDLVEGLLTGRLGLCDVPESVRDLYHLGWLDGRQSLQPELEQAHADADRYYRAAFDPEARSRITERVVDQLRVREYRNRRNAA